MRCLREDGRILNVTVESARGVVTVRCHGRLVRGQETVLLCAVIQQHGRDIILDLGGVAAIDAAGIGALLSLQAAGIYLRLVSPSLTVRQILRSTSLDSVFEISESECTEVRSGFDPKISVSCQNHLPKSIENGRAMESSGYVAPDA
jgi:anti-anti-sigma factor